VEDDRADSVVPLTGETQVPDGEAVALAIDELVSTRLEDATTLDSEEP
jgi:hypothetical protein